MCVHEKERDRQSSVLVCVCVCMCEGDKSLLENTKCKYLKFKFKSFTSQIVCYSS